MSKNILVTGGAGFIGSFIVDELIEQGHEVTVLDNLSEQVHPTGKPDYLNQKASFIKGDVRNREDVAKAFEDIEIVFHQAAAVGVGQSMYQVEDYVDVNERGTAVLWDYLINKEHSVKKFVIASSMSSYGEGLYQNESDEFVQPDLRPENQMAKGEWELKDKDGGILKPVPTPETKNQDCNSVYALTKKEQEKMSLLLGKTYGIPTTALRYFNVFGTRQSLSNPYTGVVAIFMSRIKNNNSPVVTEDGLQTRDFISVKDVVQANILAMNSSKANNQVFNVGMQNPLTIKSIAENLIQIYDSNVKPKITGRFRKGDVRHCFADISKIKKKLNFEPKISFEQQLEEIVSWSKTVQADDKFDEANKKLEEKGLF